MLLFLFFLACEATFFSASVPVNGTRPTNLMQRILLDPKKFVTGISKVGPTELAEVLSLLRGLLRTSEDEEQALVDKVTLETANARAAAIVLENVETIGLKAANGLKSATGALAAAKQARDNADKAHQTQKVAKKNAEEALSDGQDALDNEQDVLTLVIKMLGDLQQQQQPDRYSQNCNCGNRIAQWINGKNTVELCRTECIDNDQCKSFGLWTNEDKGLCALFDKVCTENCPNPTSVNEGYENDVYNIIDDTTSDEDPTSDDEGVFAGCINPQWCLQEGLSKPQHTSCESISSDGDTCINPTIKYGSVEGGIPDKHSGNRYDLWCEQLGGKYKGLITYGDREGYRLFGCTGYDDTAWHWCDWQDGYWHDEQLDNHARSDFVTSITCDES